MKIGILTLPYKSNYGGILQCVALQNVLAEEGHEVEVIRYVPREHSGILRRMVMVMSSFSSCREFFCYIKDCYKTFCKKRRLQQQAPSSQLLSNCQEFIDEQIRYSPIVHEENIAFLASRYDAIVVGSDQVWTGLGQKQLIYLFDWSPAYEGLRVSYAACSANAHVPRFATSKIKRKLQQFDALSVRDENTSRLVRQCSGVWPSVVADPTLLYDFGTLLKAPFVKEPYIFCYILGGEIQGGHKQVIDEIKKEYGDMPVVAVALPDCTLEAGDFADRIITDASPGMWLNLLAHSAFVYTDSFHGCIFSIKYQKKFLAYYTYAQRASRLMDLKKRYALNHIVVESVAEMLTNESIRKNADYSVINPLVKKYQTESFYFLRTSLHTLK